MSSELAMEKHYGSMANYRASEGRVIKVLYKGSLEKTIKGRSVDSRTKQATWRIKIIKLYCSDSCQWGQV